MPSADGHHGFSLRPWVLSDAAALAAAWRDPEVARWLDPPGSDLQAATTWIAGERARRRAGVALDLVIDIDGAAAGEVGFSSFDAARRAALVGYWVGPASRGRGLGARALAVAATFCFESIGAHALIAECDPANVASWRTAEAAGFERLGEMAGRVAYVRRR